MRELMSAGSSNPDADFYTAIKDGVAEAVKAVAREHEAMTRRQDVATESGPESPPQTETGAA